LWWLLGVVVDVARRSLTIVEEYLGEFRAVVLSGPRQSGKTTLLKQLRHHQQGAGVEMSNRTFDDATELSAAIGDPKTYVEQFRAPTAVDEFQRAGEPFLLSVKMRLDKDRSRGQLVLAGSTSFLTSKKVADSLAGRVGIVELWPFSVGEATGHERNIGANPQPDLVRSRPRSSDSAHPPHALGPLCSERLRRGRG
jgi:uncharacterized protein